MINAPILQNCRTDNLGLSHANLREELIEKLIDLGVEGKNLNTNKFYSMRNIIFSKDTWQTLSTLKVN